MNVANEKALFQIIGKNIKSYRNSANLNQAHLASQVGLSRTSLVNIEQGKQQPSLFLLWRIAEALGVETKDLIPNRFEVNATEFGLVSPTPHREIRKEETYRLIKEFIENNKVNGS